MRFNKFTQEMQQLPLLLPLPLLCGSHLKLIAIFKSSLWIQRGYKGETGH